MATIYIDGTAYTVEDGQHLLKACLQLGFNLPYFCWHPAMHTVGACRQCAVKQFRDEHDTRGRIVMACQTPAADGTRISIDDPEVKAFRAAVIEWLMINHPHDCPVCDEGGECHLQDMTVLTGHAYRRYRFSKRTYRNQYLGPFVSHEMNRCIQCYRCVRFYVDYAGGDDFGVFGAHDHVYFGRAQDGVLQNEFSGNLVEVCPTGVFTDATLKRHYTRKWDLQTAPSICVHCGLGCNIIPGERYGTLRRVRNRYNGEVNGYFLCDRGRYGYEFVNSAGRVRVATHRSSMTADQGAAPLDRLQALDRVVAVLAGSRAIGIGSPRASLEANFALRTLVGPDRFYTGASDADNQVALAGIDALRQGPFRSATLRVAESCDAVLVLGEDVTNVAPRLALALRQAVWRQPAQTAAQLRIPPWHDSAVREVIQDALGPLYIATPCATKLEEVARRAFHAAPDDLAGLAGAVAQRLAAQRVDDAALPEEARAFVGQVVGDLAQAQRPLIVSGLSLGHEGLVRGAAAVATALCAMGKPAEVAYVMPECNTLGLALIGGSRLSEALRAVREGAADTVVVLENDLYRRAQADAVDELFAAAKHVVALDCVANDTTERAEIVLPAATFAEADGTLINGEGRAQRFFQVIAADGDVQESWRWLRDIMHGMGRREHAAWDGLDDIIADLVAAIPHLGAIAEAAPPATYRRVGMKIPRQPSRYSGRTAIHANVSVSERRSSDDPDSPLAFSMEGYDGQPPPPLIPRFWSPNWNSMQAVSKFQEEIAGPLRGGDPGKRLIEPGERGDTRPGNFPSAFQGRSGELLIVPLYHIFGSEELSVLAPGVGELAPAPYLALNPHEARELSLRAGDRIELALAGRVRQVVVKLTPSLPKGVAGLPSGIPVMAGIVLPMWSKLSESIVRRLDDFDEPRRS